MNRPEDTRAEAILEEERAAFVPRQAQEAFGLSSPAQPHGKKDMDTALAAMKQIIMGICSVVPGWGTLIGVGLGIGLSYLWPSGKDDVWLEIEERVKKLVKKEIKDLYRKFTENQLKGLYGLCARYKKSAEAAYKNSASNKDKEDARTDWKAIETAIINDLPAFQDKDYKVAILPLFVQVANIHLFILRDMCINGEKLGFGNQKINDCKTTLSNLTQGSSPTYINYVMDTYKAGWDEIDTLAKKVEFHREMWFAAVEYAQVYWRPFGDWQKKYDTVDRDVEIFWGPFGKQGAGSLDNLFTKDDFVHRPAKTGRLTGVKAWCKEYENEKTGHKYRLLHGMQMRQGSSWQTIDGSQTGDCYGCEEKPPYCPGEGKYFQGFHVYHDPKNGIFNYVMFQDSTGENTEYLGSLGYPNEEHVDCGIQDFEVSQARIVDFDHRKHPSAMLFAFRPVSTKVKYKEIKPSLQNMVLCQPEDMDHVLAPQTYSVSGETELSMSQANGTLAQQWEFQDAGKGLFHLVNRYSRQYLIRTPQGVRQGDADHRATEALWRQVHDEEGLLSLADPGDDSARLGVDRDRVVLGGAEGTRWVAVPTVAADSLRLPATPALDTESGPGSSRVRVTVPRDSEEVPDWNVSFYLPSEAGDQIDVQGAVVASTDRDERGLRVTVTAQDPRHRSLAAGTAVEFTVTAPMSGRARDRALALADVRLNGTHVSG
ncbi:insecticidal delta-endotoxin Cry8Ea1 family protein [Nocardiopsis tropica]|uniref:insecticidal delta-endotoxin Cry8Ea1 family protein n=1 Tax=Nocardiopsis tropica TaxID=109330 RepID=UPI002E82F33F|nr:insecticidal delta-endotoxin Cry8Ea1 family protein [Nocardiopsis tropica]